MEDISTKSVLVYDRGLHTFQAQKLGESFKKVYYYMPDSSPYPNSSLSNIGQGLPEIERVDDAKFWKILDKVDAVIFPDCYDGPFQLWLKANGHAVFGGLGSEKVEMDKIFFLDYLEKIGLPVPMTYRAEGIEDLEKYLKTAKPPQWLKRSYYRGDFETHKFVSMKQIEPWLDRLRIRIGRRVDDIEILVQEQINTIMETGWDGFCVNGEFTQNGLIGYELKDKAYIAKIFKDPPKIVKKVNVAMGPLFKKLGFQGHWSTEIRVTKGGKGYFIDPTPRTPSPPGELMCELYSNYADAVYQIAHGEVPDLEPKAQYGAEIILTSSWNETDELCVEFPDDLSPYIKLKNHCKRNGSYYCTPNNNDGFFGAVIGYADTMKSAIQNCLDVIQEVQADGLEFDKDIFMKATAEIEAGKGFGIDI